MGLPSRYERAAAGNLLIDKALAPKLVKVGLAVGVEVAVARVATIAIATIVALVVALVVAPVIVIVVVAAAVALVVVVVVAIIVVALAVAVVPARISRVNVRGGIGLSRWHGIRPVTVDCGGRRLLGRRGHGE